LTDVSIAGKMNRFKKQMCLNIKR